MNHEIFTIIDQESKIQDKNNDEIPRGVIAGNFLEPDVL